MIDKQTGVGTRTTARRDSRSGHDQTAFISEEERKEWIASVDVATLDDTALPPIPPLAGMEQRWVRIKLGGEIDAKNLSDKERQGWRPRPADTVAKAYQNMRLDSGEFAGTIGVHDLVLMHRPAEIGEQRRQILDQRVKEKDLAVKTMQFRESDPTAADSRYVQNESPDLRSRVETGVRTVEVPD